MAQMSHGDARDLHVKFLLLRREITRTAQSDRLTPVPLALRMSRFPR